MSQLNPTKEFIIPKSIEEVRKAILKLNEAEPTYYVLERDNKMLNQITLHQKGSMLDVGYHIDFLLKKISEEETKVNIEISRRMGSINTGGEMSIANNSMKTITDKFTAFLEGNVDEYGKAKVPANTGCALILIVGIGGLLTLIIS